jgi:50S ribosomal protein L16 3-hydroxylase
MVEMLQGFTDFLAENINIEERFVDRREKIPENISEISNDDLSESYLRIKSMVDNKSHFLTWFGCHMTQPKYPNLVEASNDNCDKKIENGSTLKRSPHSRFAYSYGDNNEIMLFADGEAFIFDRLHERSIKIICEASRIEISKLEGYLDSDNIRETITLLCACGSLLIE